LFENGPEKNFTSQNNNLNKTLTTKVLTAWLKVLPQSKFCIIVEEKTYLTLMFKTDSMNYKFIDLIITD